MRTKTLPRTNHGQNQGILFEFTDPLACSVSISGTFNDWHPNATPMLSVKDGHWAKRLTLPPGVYEYRFVVDGRWVSDPLASASAPNPYGDLNSVRVVPNRGDDATQPKRERDSVKVPPLTPPRRSRVRNLTTQQLSARA
jgi:1,4-alpha-glucan branching enzyme